MFQVKIGDFGSAEWKVSPRVKKVVSTREYRAPEVMLGTPLTTALDIWSVGTMASSSILFISKFISDLRALYYGLPV